MTFSPPLHSPMMDGHYILDYRHSDHFSGVAIKRGSTVVKYLGVPSFLEREVKSIIPLSDLQTQVSPLPGTGGHRVPLGVVTTTKGKQSSPSSTMRRRSIASWLDIECVATSTAIPNDNNIATHPFWKSHECLPHAGYNSMIILFMNLISMNTWTIIIINFVCHWTSIAIIKISMRIKS